MTMQVMIDLETMSVRSDAAVLSIGAVKFDPLGKVGAWGDVENPEYKDFYANIDLQSCLDFDMHLDGRTVMWWLQQSEDARRSLTGTYATEPVSLEAALSEFAIWFGMESLATWGNGAAFDCVILRNAFLATGRQPPFKYSHERCYRTIRAILPDVPYVGPTTAHNALSDAQAQAVHLQKLYNFINTKGIQP